MNSNCDGGLGHSTPISGTFLDCCARAARGQTAAALPNVTMNSRRLMGFTPVAETRSLAHLFRDLCWLTRDFGTGRTRTACPLWVTCGRRLGKNFLTLLQHWSGAVTCPACLCGGFGRWP